MHHHTPLRGATLALLASLTALVLPSPPAGATSTVKPVNALVSVAPSSKTGNGQSMVSSLSNGGRYVAFASVASDLVAGDTNAKSDIFVRDVLTATTIRVSVAGAGTQGDGASDQPSISRDGRYVAFRSDATNLVASDTNGVGDVFVRDLRNKTTIRASVAAGSNAEATGGGSAHPVMAGNGFQVAFDSTATNLVPGDGNGLSDVFVRDFDTVTTDRITVTSAEAALSSGGTSPSISGNGRYVTFTSMTNQVGAFTDSSNDVFLRDRAAGTTDRVSLSGEPALHPDGASYGGSVSDDGRYVAFTSIAGNLSPNSDTNSAGDAYLRDRQLQSTELVSQSTTGAATSLGTAGAPSISGDGKQVAFTGLSTGFVGGDTNGAVDVFVRSSSGVTTRLSTTTSGGQLDGSSQYPVLSGDGTAITYSTLSKVGYPLDGNDGHDVYVRAANQYGPFTDVTSLLQRNAQDFTGKPLSATALTAAKDKIGYGTASTASTINAWAHGTFDDDRGPILRLYWSFLKRAPDTGGLNYWAAKHANGTKMAQIANGFAASNEFKTNFGGGTDTQFITLVYTNVLERQPDQAGLAHWLAKMTAGTTRGEMMVNFSESSEGIRKMRGETDTALVLLGMLHRAPSTGEVISYANALELQGGQATEVLILAVLTWDEYDSLVH